MLFGPNEVRLKRVLCLTYLRLGGRFLRQRGGEI